MDIIKKALELHENGEEFCLAVLIAKSGSAPQVPGAKGIFLRDGRIFGTIGGGCLEMECRRLGLQALYSGKHLVREFQLDDDFGWDDGLICGGRVQVLLLPKPEKYISAFRQALSSRGCLVYDLKEGGVRFDSIEEIERRPLRKGDLFIEPILPPERLIIFGGGHIGKELSRLGKELGFFVTLVDDRPEFVSEERVPWVQERICEQPEEFAKKIRESVMSLLQGRVVSSDISEQQASLCKDISNIQPDETYICIVTRGHRNDSKVLRSLVGLPWAYLGMIGSNRKREMIKKEMVSSGLCSEEEFERVRSPMGLEIGAEGVMEIVVSIAAELVQVRSEYRGPIAARCGQKRLVSE
ncbi:MAG TPA: XdhC family protein [Fimbriimonadales bacterium]|nr:XdhC family protein [Fimbriimonadales bacterium]